MERVNIHRTKEVSLPKSDEAAHFGRFSAGKRRGEETPELLTGYLVRIGTGRILTSEEELDLGRRVRAGGHGGSEAPDRDGLPAGVLDRGRPRRCGHRGRHGCAAARAPGHGRDPVRGEACRLRGGVGQDDRCITATILRTR
jgi:Sigma-70 factor, region 1.2